MDSLFCSSVCVQERKSFPFYHGDILIHTRRRRSTRGFVQIDEKYLRMKAWNQCPSLSLSFEMMREQKFQSLIGEE